MDVVEPSGAKSLGGSQGLMDADDFLRFAERLRALRKRVDRADVSAQQRGRWQRRLVGLTDAAQRDFAAAQEQLNRFEAEVERHLGR